MPDAAGLARELDALRRQLERVALGLGDVIASLREPALQRSGETPIAATPEAELVAAAIAGDASHVDPWPAAERRSGYDRRSAEDRRKAQPDGVAARVLRSIDRRSGVERRSGADRRAVRAATGGAS